MKLLIVLLLFCLPSAVDAQDLYKWKDSRDQWRLSTTPPPGSAAETPAIKDRPSASGAAARCAGFGIGETRRATSYRRALQSPLQLIDIEIKRLPGDASGYFSWKALVQNYSDRPVVAAGRVKLKNCSEFVVAQARLPRAVLPPGSLVALDGIAVVDRLPREDIANFSIAIGSAVGSD